MIHKCRTSHGEKEVLADAAPSQGRDIFSRPSLRQQTPETRKQFRVCRSRSCRSWKFELEIGTSRNADFFANEPICRGLQFYLGILNRSGRRNLLQEQNLVVVSVGLDVAR